VNRTKPSGSSTSVRSPDSRSDHVVEFVSMRVGSDIGRDNADARVGGNDAANLLRPAKSEQCDMQQCGQSPQCSEACHSLTWFTAIAQEYLVRLT
jgi:hypothetical protein